MRIETRIDGSYAAQSILRVYWQRQRMGLMHLIVLGCGILLGVNGKALSIEEALGMIESGNNDRAVGKAGEISRYQIKKDIWWKHSASPTFWDRNEAWRVAEKVLAQRMADYHRYTGRAPDPFDIYVLWNAPGQFRTVRYQKQRISPVVSERAARFANLLREAEPSRLASRRLEPRELLLAGQVSAPASPIVLPANGSN